MTKGRVNFSLGQLTYTNTHIPIIFVPTCVTDKAAMVGPLVGPTVGHSVGRLEGTIEGSLLGRREGISVGRLGIKDG